MVLGKEIYFDQGHFTMIAASRVQTRDAQSQTLSRRFLMPLQQTKFENIVAKGKMANNEQFIILPQFVNSIQ